MSALVPRFEDAGREQRYRQAQLEQSLRPVRGALVVSALLLSTFALPDVALNPPEVWHWLLANRFGLCVPLLLLPLLASYSAWGRRNLVGLLGAMVVLVYVAQGAGTFSVLPMPLRHEALFAMLAVVVLQYFIYGLPIRVLYFTGFALSAAHVVLCAAVGLPPHLVFMHGFVVLVLGGGCLFAALQLERSKRRGFAANEDLRAAQADLVRAERMASVATLVRGVAHELNNPINYIAGNMAPLRRYCDFLTGVATSLSDGQQRTPEELAALTRLSARKDLAFVADDLARLTADVSEGARRAQLIISDLQSLSAQRAIELVDLHRAARQTVALLQPRVPPAVRLELELSPVPPLPARAGQLEQVLVNLTDNALRAVGREGVVRLSMSSEGGEALIRVTDDGPGMSDEVKRHALEPFFTTRAPGEGSGLGLAIVASIVGGHQGRIELQSVVGRGTTIEVRLPLEPQ